MKHLLSLLITFFLSHLSASETDILSQLPQPGLLTSLDSEPSAFIDGCVNAISGDFIDFEQDMVIPGPEPMAIERVHMTSDAYSDHCPKAIGTRWHFSYQGRVIVWDKLNHKNETVGYNLKYLGPLGSNHYFRGEEKIKKKGGAAHIQGKSLRYGVTNSSSGIIAAKTNAHNHKMEWKADHDQIEIKTADGRKLFFEKFGGGNFFLENEYRPSGLHFRHLHDKTGRLTHVDQFSKTGERLAHFDLDQSKYDKRVILTAPDGRKVTYSLEEVKGKNTGNDRGKVERDKVNGDRSATYVITKVDRPEAPPVEYEYQEGNFEHSKHGKEKSDDSPKRPYGERIIKKRLPEGRGLDITYYRHGHNHIMGEKKNVDFDSGCFQKVKELWAPIGVGSTMLPKYHFKYHMPDGPEKGGITKAYDALLRKTEYEFSRRKRLKSVTKFYADKTPYVKEELFYGERDTIEEIRLIGRCFGNCSSPFKIFAKTLSYDAVGNVLQETLYGNLTGTKNIPFGVDARGVPTNPEVERVERKYAYSEDDLHLLLEAEENGVKKSYAYYPSSSLITSCLHSVEGVIFLREFYDYDDSGMVIFHIEDDGTTKDRNDLTGVTQRKIETIKRSEKYPAGLPLEITESYLDLATGATLDKIKTVNHYNRQGRLILQETFGSDGEFCYAESYTYDPHGNLLTHKNPLGFETARAYDLNDNLIEEHGLNPRLTKMHGYDYSNRKLFEGENHPEGVFKKHYCYDVCSNRVESIDLFGHATTYVYDDFNRVIKKILPPVPNEDGVFIRPEYTFAYDEMSNPVALTDPKGNTTRFEYTLYGKPYRISYPNGTEERFEYDLYGRVVKEVSKSGTYTVNTYDHLNRVILKQVFSADRELLSSVTSTYSTFHLLSETDAMGNVTSYSYDSMGRKVVTEKNGLLTAYTYDPLSRIIETKVTSIEHPEEGSVKWVAYDAMNHMIEEQTRDLQGAILISKRMRYDAEGHLVEAEQAGDVVTTVYDTHGLPSIKTDAAGYIARTYMKFDFYNEHGQRVLVLESVDPLGQMTRTIHDTHGRIVKVIKLDPFGQEIQTTHSYFDACGNLIKIVEEGVTTLYSYDAMSRPIEEVLAAGTKDERRTKTCYTAMGAKKSHLKQDGTVLSYSYDPLERLKEEISSDGTIHYRYSYDPLGNVILVEDLIHETKTTRMYDLSSRLIEETLANGLKVCFSYTAEGNIKTITHPDGSVVLYDYQGPLLKGVTKISPEGEKEYCHRYTKHNLFGKVERAAPIHELDEIRCSYTPRGEIAELSYPGFEEKLRYDPVGNLVLRERGEEVEEFSFDSLYQLTAEKMHSYSYDSLYNRLSKDGAQLTLNNLNQLLEGDGVIYEYDPNGNLVKEKRGEGEKIFAYDAKNRLIKMTVGATTIEYTYDENNRLMTKSIFVDGENVLYERLFFAGQKDIGTVDREGKIVNLRVLGGALAAEIGASIAIELEGEVFAPVHDHRGNIVGLINGKNEVVARYHYTAFGEEEIEGGVISPWRFSSKRNENGFVLYGERFYNPETGRWLTPDPIGRAGGANFYAFLLNSPLTHIDAFGLASLGVGTGSPGSGGGGLSSFLESAWNFICSGAQYVANCVGTVASGALQAIQYTGRTIQQAAHHVLPTVVGQDLLAACGHCLEYGTLKGFIPSFRSGKSSITPMEPLEVGYGQQVVVFNGILTDEIGAEKMGKLVQSYFPDSTVHMVHDQTHGAVTDLGDVGLSKLGICTHASELGVKAIRSAISASGGVGSGNVVHIIAHSQGGSTFSHILHHLTPEEKAMLSVSTFGSATLINDQGLRDCVNYVHRSDAVPFAGNPPGYISACCGFRSNVVFVGDRGFNPHHTMKNAYEGALETDADVFKKRYGR